MWQETARRLAHNSARTRNGRHAPKTLTTQQVYDMLEAQDYRCAVTGVYLEPSLRGPSKPFQASIDRIDQDVGYEPENVRVVALIVNYAMNHWGEEAFRDLLRQARVDCTPGLDS